MRLTITYLFITAILTLTGARSHEAQDQSLCNDVIRGWLDTLKPRVEYSNATLVIDWKSLQEKIDQDDACNLENTYLELWRVTGESFNRPKNFGSHEYFAAYERCKSLEPESFVHHSSLAYLSNRTHMSYRHVVEDKYMLRVCPCGRRRHQRTHQRVCDCQRSGVLMSAQCTQVFDITPPDMPRSPLPQELMVLEPEEEPPVMPWCRQYSDPKLAAYEDRNKFSLTALLLNCTHLFITGSMASCTKIQPYDRIMLSFHKINNMSNNDCWLHKDFGDYGAIQKEVRLYSKSPIEANYSAAIGEFTVIMGLSQDSKYCVIVEHVDHPYCTVHTDTEITIGQHHQKMPNICSAHMGKPVSTSKCSLATPDIVTQFPLTHDRVFLIVVICISLVVMSLCGVTIKKWFCKRRQQGRKKYEFEDQKGFVDRLIPVTHPDHFNEVPMTNSRVFLLHFLKGEEEDVRCVLLRDWIKTIGQVDDLEDYINEECINEDPEGWVLSKLSAQDVRVVVVSSMDAAHHLKSTKSENLRNSDITTGGASTSSCTTTSTEVTSGSPSSSESSLHQDQEMNCSTYQEDDEAEEGDIEVSSCEALLRNSKFECSDDHDPRHELRVFALKHIQKHMSGNYRQLAVVSFEKFCPVGENVASMLTPTKGPLVLPNHLPDLQEWVISKKAAANHVHRPCCSHGGSGHQTSSQQHHRKQKTFVQLGVPTDQCSAENGCANGGGDLISVVDQSTLAAQRLREVLSNSERDKL